MVSQVLLLIYFKVDNGTNVCGIEFNYNNNNSSGIDDEEDLRSIIGEDESNREVFYNDQIFRQLFLGFQVVSEEGRSVGRCSICSQSTSSSQSKVFSIDLKLQSFNNDSTQVG